MPIETWIKVWRAGFAISTLGVIQFIVCCLIAISLYPGGTMVDETTIGFSATDNYLSDLGREVSFSGQDNSLGAQFFNWSLTALGFTMLPFFFFMPTQANDRVVVLLIAAFLGSTSAVSLIVMGLGPIGLFPIQHMLGLFIWLVTLFFASSIHGMAMLTSKDKPTMLALVSVLVAVVSVSYMYHGTQTMMAVWHEEEIPLQAALMQKFVFIVSLIWILSFSVKLLLTTDFSEFYDRDIESETNEYLNQLEDNPRRVEQRHLG